MYINLLYLRFKFHRSNVVNVTNPFDEVWLFDKISDDMVRRVEIFVEALSIYAIQRTTTYIWLSLVNFSDSFFLACFLVTLIYLPFFCSFLLKKKVTRLITMLKFGSKFSGWLYPEMIRNRMRLSWISTMRWYQILCEIEDWSLCMWISIPAPFSEHAHACLYTCYESERCRGD